MTKTLFAGVLSAALALSGFTASPARADNDDVAKALAAIAAIALIGAAIDHRNDRLGRTPPAAPPQPRLEVLPSACVFEIWDRGRPGHALSARCVSEQMRHPERLPQSCRAEVEVMPWQQDRGRGRDRVGDRGRDHGQSRLDRTRAAYDIGCLTRAGYRFDR